MPVPTIADVVKHEIDSGKWVCIDRTSWITISDELKHAVILEWPFSDHHAQTFMRKAGERAGMAIIDTGIAMPAWLVDKLTFVAVS